MGEPAVSPTYCPINGAYTFTYSVNDGTENSLECQQVITLPFLLAIAHLNRYEIESNLSVPRIQGYNKNALI